MRKNITTILILLFVFGAALSANAATVTWTGGGADNLVSNPANWSGGIVPQNGDEVVFDATSSKDCTWDIYVVPASLTLDSGYTGAVTLNLDLTVTGNVIISGGTLYQNNKNFKIGFGAAEVPPYPPSGLSATAISSTQIDLSWSDNSNNETGFKIERKTGAGGTYSEIDTVLADVTTYSDTGLAEGTTYYYKARAYNTAGSSAYSNEANATTILLPTATTNPATNVTHDSARLNATVNPNGLETMVYFELGTDTNYGLFTSSTISIGSGTNNVIVWVDVIGFSPESTYHYRVVAANVGGTSYGNDVSFTTNPLPGTIEINVTLDGVAWSGSVNYTITGPETINGAAVPATFTGKQVGSYTLTYNSGGPVNAILSSITPSATQTLQTEGTITFTLNFIYSPPTATTDPATHVNGNSATLNATVNPNNSETTVYFEWGLDTNYGNVTSVQSIGSGANDVSVSEDITSLSPNTTYHYRVVATNAYGTNYGADESFTTPPITLIITSPSDSDTINRPDVMVKGTVTNSLGNETGVTVNGIVAVVYGNQFFVNHVPLEEGANTITASATDTAGNTASTAITVNAETTTPHITLNANITSGIPPLTTYFSVSTSIPNAVASYSFDYEGDAVVDYTGPTFDDMSVTYTIEGIYYPTVTVTDTEGYTYSDTIAIVVLNASDLDALLRAKWEAMTNSLSTEDITTALTYISESTRTDYEEMFNALIGQLSSIVATATEFNLISNTDHIVKYELVTTENSELYAYEVVFIKNKDGIWMILEF